MVNQMKDKNHEEITAEEKAKLDTALTEIEKIEKWKQRP